MLKKKIIVNGELTLSADLKIELDDRALDSIIAERVGIIDVGEYRLGHVKITIEPVIYVCPVCKSAILEHDPLPHGLRNFSCLHCWNCDHAFNEKTAEKTNPLIVAQIKDRCEFVSFRPNENRNEWERFLEINLEDIGGAFHRWDAGINDYAEIYLVDSLEPKDTDRVTPYSVSVDKKKDQHGEPIPTDLVLMPDYENVNEHLFTSIMFVYPWYECEGALLISAEQIGYVSEAEPANAGIDLVGSDVLRVADALKRCNTLDGFFHA